MDDRVADRGLWIPQFRWGAVFAGAFVGLGVWVLLYAFGLAVGLTSLDPADPRFAGAWTGLWTLLSPLIALFLGGLVAARVAGPTDRTTGAIHGAVMWGVTTVAGVFAVGSLVGTLVAGLGQAGRSAAQGLGGSGISTQELLGPVNQKLRAEGKPPVTQEQLGGALKDVANDVAAGKPMNKESFAQSLSQNTDMSRQDAMDIANRVEAQVGSAGQALQSGAGRAADISGKVFWGIFISLALGLVASILGGTAGVSRKQSEVTA